MIDSIVVILVKAALIYVMIRGGAEAFLWMGYRSRKWRWTRFDES